MFSREVSCFISQVLEQLSSKVEQILVPIEAVPRCQGNQQNKILPLLPKNKIKKMVLTLM